MRRKPDWENFEEVVHEAALSVYRRVEDCEPLMHDHGRKSERRGKSGVGHQIDVQIEGPSDLILAECKWWKSRVNIGKLRDFACTVGDIAEQFHGKTYGMFFARSGFQSSARFFADYKEIDLRIVTSLEEFSILYKNLLLVRPKPATLVASVVPPTVVISDPPSIVNDTADI